MYFTHVAVHILLGHEIIHLIVGFASSIIFLLKSQFFFFLACDGVRLLKER